MNILCNILGHKPETIGAKKAPLIRRTGWELDYNEAHRWVEFGYNCRRCNRLIQIGIYSEPKGLKP